MQHEPPTLFQTVDAYLRDSGLKPTRFGKLVNNDPMLVADLRDGRDVRKSTEQRILAFIRENPPAQGAT